MDRSRMIAALVADAEGDSDYTKYLLRNGHPGFNNMTDEQLDEQCKGANLLGYGEECEHGMFKAGSGSCPQCASNCVPKNTVPPTDWAEHN